MPERNETAPLNCRFLSDDHFAILHEKFLEAFSDYALPFQLTEAQFRNHIVLNAVDLDSSVGCFDGDQLVGLTLNGFGMWNAISTVYDAGTGVVPHYRRRGISEAMFDTMLPVFKERGYEQCLLEVITTNDPAVSLYKKLGFQTVRELLLLQLDEPFKVGHSRSDVEVRELSNLDTKLFGTFWDGRPSWQNSNDAVSRSMKVRKILGAFIEGRCVGYVTYSAGFGRISQFAVDRNFRRQGIGTRLLLEMSSDTPETNKLQVINIDSSITEAVDFFRNRGFKKVLGQYEMIKTL